MLVGSLGEYIPEDAAVKDSKPPGDWVADGGSDWRKDAGEDGGAMNGRTIEDCWDRISIIGASVVEEPGSGTRTACPIFLFRFWDPKHDEMLQKLPHLRFFSDWSNYVIWWYGAYEEIYIGIRTLISIPTKLLQNCKNRTPGENRKDQLHHLKKKFPKNTNHCHLVY